MSFTFGIGSPGGVNAPFLPNQIPGIAWWQEIDISPLIIATGISSIGDLTTFGRNAVQALGGRQPALVANVFNTNKSAAHYAGTSINSTTCNGATVGTTVCRFLVGKYGSAVAAGTMCDGNAGGGGNQGRIYRASATDLHLNFGAEVVATTTPENPHIYTIVNAPGANAGKFYVDNVLIGSATPSAQLAIHPVLGTFGDGASDPGDVFMTADIGYTTIPTALQMAQMCAYLKRKYATP